MTRFCQLSCLCVAHLPDLNAEQITALAKENQRYWLAWSDWLGAWIETSGKTVTVLVHEDAQSMDLNELTLGFTSTLTGFCLNLQGQVAIHANAVYHSDRAIALVGPSGAGKSTLSTFCVQQGMGLLTDDVLVVDQQDRVLPGNPRLKLFPHTSTALQLQVPDEPTAYKVFYDAATLAIKTSELPVKLNVIYLLNAAEVADIRAEPVPPSQALFDLLNNGYVAREFSEVLPRLLDRYRALIHQVPVMKLIYPHDFSQLPQVYRLLLDRLQA